MTLNKIPSIITLHLICGAFALSIAAGLSGESAPRVVRSENSLSVTIISPSSELTSVDLEGRAFQTLPSKDGATIGVAGGPGIPADSRLVEVPAGTRASLSFEIGSTSEIRSVDLAPIPLLGADNPDLNSTSVDPALYQTDRLIPEQPAFLSEPFNVGGRRYVTLTVSPYQYNPAEKILLVHSGLHAEVVFTPAAEQSDVGRFDIPAWRELNSALSDGPSRDDLALNTEHLGHLVIVVPNNNDFQNAVTPLVEWKKRKGYVVTVVRMVRDLENTAPALKGFLADAHDNWDIPPDFILLIGDASVMPCFRDQQAEGASWYISDNQYVTFGRDPGNNIDTWVADAFIGRLPSASAQETVQMVAKIVGYESRPYVEQAWVKGAALLAAGVHSCIETNRAIREQMLDYGYASNRIAEAYTEYHAGSPNVDQRTVDEALNGNNQERGRGIGFVNFRGYDLWGGYVNGQIHNLTNGWKLPIVTGMVCATNDYANRFGGESVGEAWLRSWANNVPSGAVASYGPTDRHTHTWFNNTMDGEFYRLLLSKNVHTLGALALGSKLSLLRNYPSLLNGLGNGESVGYYFFTYNILGDPSLQVWTDDPHPMSVIYDAEIPTGSTNLSFLVLNEDDEPVQGAYVHVYADDDHRHGAFTDETGNAVFAIPPLEEGECSVTVTATNFIPVLDEMNVVTQTVFASIGSITIDDDDEGDSQGNGDGLVSPGETIELQIEIGNRGSEALESVDASISSDNPFVAVGRDSASYGDIEQGAAADGNAPFFLNIAPDLPPGMPIEIALTISVGDEEFNSLFTLDTKGYEIGLVEYETVGGDLLPGSIRQVLITIENQGQISTAPLTATLFCENPTIQIRQAETIYETLEPGENGQNERRPFEVFAGPLAYQGSDVPFGLLFTDENGRRDSLSFTITLGEPSVNSPQGPDDYGYWAFDLADSATGIEPVYERVQGQTNLNISDQNDVQSPTGIGGAVRVIDLPFEFMFYGRTYDRATVSTNGWLSFSESVVIGWNNQEIGSGLTPAAMIAPYWEDLWSGQIFTRYDEDNARFIVEWRNFSSARGNSINFALVLYDPTVVATTTGDGEIVVQYMSMPRMMRDIPEEAVTIGISSHDRTTGLTVRHARTADPRTAAPNSPMAIKFTTGPNMELGAIAGQVTDVETNSPISAVRVMLDGTGFFDLTDENGRYSIEGAPIGTYTVVARKLGFNEDMAADIQINLDETTELDFSLTHPDFAIDIERIRITVPPDSVRRTEFNIVNSGSGPLDFRIDINHEPEGAGRDEAWDTLFNWDVSAAANDQFLRGMTTDGEFFYISAQRARYVYPHPIYVFNREGELVREIPQYSVDSTISGYRCMDFNGQNLVAVEDTSIVELTREGEFVGSVSARENPTYSVAWSPSRGTYFTKSLTGHEISEIDANNELVNEFRLPWESARLYGMAWNPADEEGFNLILARHNSEAVQLELHKLNLETGEIRLIRAMALLGNDTPIDIAITKKFSPLLWTLVVLMNHSGGDHLMGFEFAPNLTWIDYNPPSGSIPAGETQAFTVDFMAEDMPMATYNVVLELRHNAIGELHEIPVAFTVGWPVSVPENQKTTPFEFSLEAVYPNPFNARTTVNFNLVRAGVASLRVFDAMGREQRSIELGRLEPGRHSTVFDGEGLSSGIYLVRLETTNGIATRKMVLMR